MSSRADRPSDFAVRPAQIESDPSRPCPFCEGGAEAVPAITELSDSERPECIVPNRYPAFEGDESLAVRTFGPVHVQAEASGVHELLVYSQDHDANLATLSDDEIASMMHVLRKRFTEHAAQPHIRYTQAIVNHGARRAPRSPTRTASSSECRSYRARSWTRNGRSPASPVAASSAPRSRPNWSTNHEWSSPTTTVS
ncbi:MAG: hypothetical protein R2705_12170 [Ilumatobacteraceae bacterium]